jgi:hypothetical protein
VALAPLSSSTQGVGCKLPGRLILLVVWLLRNPTRTVLVWTVLCAVPAVWIFIAAYTASGQLPVLCQPACTPGDIAWIVAVPIILIIALVWLLGTMAIRWLWERSNRA